MLQEGCSSGATIAVADMSLLKAFLFREVQLSSDNIYSSAGLQIRICFDQRSSFCMCSVPKSTASINACDGNLGYQNRDPLREPVASPVVCIYAYRLCRDK